MKKEIWGLIGRRKVGVCVWVEEILIMDVDREGVEWDRRQGGIVSETKPISIYMYGIVFCVCVWIMDKGL